MLVTVMTKRKVLPGVIGSFDPSHGEQDLGTVKKCLQRDFYSQANPLILCFLVGPRIEGSLKINTWMLDLREGSHFFTLPLCLH